MGKQCNLDFSRTEIIARNKLCVSNKLYVFVFVKSSLHHLVHLFYITINQMQAVPLYTHTDTHTHTLSTLRGWGSLIIAIPCKFVYIAHNFIFLRIIPLTLVLIGRDGGLSTLCHSFRFDYQQRVLKTFHGPGYFRSEDGVV